LASAIQRSVPFTIFMVSRSNFRVLAFLSRIQCTDLASFQFHFDMCIEHWSEPYH